MTLAAIRTALTTALTSLVSTASPQPSGTLRSVQQWAGEINRTQPVDLDALGRTPAALIALARESYSRQVETLTGEVQLLGVSEWVVFLASSNAQEPGAVTTQLDALLHAAIGALAELPVDGLYGTGRLSLGELRPYRVRPGVQVYVLTLRAVRAIGEVAHADDSVALEDVQGSINLQGPGVLTNLNPTARTRNNPP